MRWAAAALLVALLTTAGRAWANGALPASFGILLPAEEPQQIVLATNFGMIISDDAGARWRWTCEQPETALGYLYAVGPGPRHRFYALSPSEGLAFSDDRSCSWRRSGGALSSVVASDFFVDGSNGDRVLAVAATVDVDGGAIGTPSLFESTDGGVTFGATPLYVAAGGANIVGIEIARSSPMVVYMALYTTPGRHPHLLQSTDGGRSWMDRDVEAALGANEVRILSVDPKDANVLYLRVVGFGTESIAVTRDAGATFATPVTIRGGTLSAFLRLASGTVLVGGLVNLDGGSGMSGVGFRSTDGGRSFVDWALRPQPRILGLAERDGVLYLAGKNYSDGWALATSRDEGVTITPLSSYEDVRGVMPCATSICGDQCRLVASQGVWTNDVCTGALQDAGDAGPAQPPESGCHCAAGGAASGAALAVGALVAGALAVARRRRR